MERRLFGKILCLSLFTKTIPNVFAIEAISYSIDEDKCIGCGACVTTCEVEAISMENQIAKIDQSICVLLGDCYWTCPVDAVVKGY